MDSFLLRPIPPCRTAAATAARPSSSSNSPTLVLTLVGIVLATAFTPTLAPPPPGNLPSRVLLISDPRDSHQYDGLAHALHANGFEVDRPHAHDTVHLLRDGQWAYCGVALFSSSPSNTPTLSLTSLLDFVDRGNGSVLLAAAPAFSTEFATIAHKLAGVHLQKNRPQYRVIDHTNFHPNLGATNHDFIIPAAIAQHATRLSADVDPRKIAFRGIAASLDTDNELVEPILWPSHVAYTAQLDTPITHTGDPPLVGTGAVLASALQTRRGARVVFVGSAEMFADHVRKHVGEDHIRFTSQLASWTFGHQGHLRVAGIRHSLHADGSTSETYRSRDVLDFQIDLQEWHGPSRAWLPYHAQDIQLEFTMMDPYQRSRLLSHQNSTYSAVVHVPDVIGIFKFSVEYIRLGVSQLLVSKTVAVRPFNHNEFERFILQAYPYYASTFSILVAVLLFGLVMFYGQHTAPKTKLQ